MGKRSVVLLVRWRSRGRVGGGGAAGSRAGHRVQVSIPTHLTVGDQIFEGNFAGLRAYLDMTKLTDPQLFAQLSPELEQLETEPRRRTASSRWVRPWASRRSSTASSAGTTARRRR